MSMRAWAGVALGSFGSYVDQVKQNVVMVLICSHNCIFEPVQNASFFFFSSDFYYIYSSDAQLGQKSEHKICPSFILFPNYPL